MCLRRDHLLGLRAAMPVVRCKSHGASDPGLLRGTADRKSRCPGWLSDARLRQALLDEALVDEEAGRDSFERPKVVWNAINDWYLIGVSTNEPEPAYNCYPEEPHTLLDELAQRASRSIEDLSTGPGND